MFKKQIRVSSGVSQLDRQLGGLFIGDNVVWYDDAGSLASLFCLNFIRESQQQRKEIKHDRRWLHGLILLGMLLHGAMELTGMDAPELGGILEILGIVGLIMIVLEADDFFRAFFFGNIPDNQ